MRRVFEFLLISRSLHTNITHGQYQKKPIVINEAAVKRSTDDRTDHHRISFILHHFCSNILLLLPLVYQRNHPSQQFKIEEDVSLFNSQPKYEKVRDCNFHSNVSIFLFKFLKSF